MIESKDDIERIKHEIVENRINKIEIRIGKIEETEDEIKFHLIGESNKLKTNFACYRC